MKKKILGMLMCMLLIATSVPAVESLKNSSINPMVPNAPPTSITANWTEMQKLLALDGTARDQFGMTVSLSGDTALIGAPQDDDNGNFSGSAYVFTHNGTTWTQQQKLLASDGAPSDGFGFSVSIVGDTALIGAPGNCDNGSVYVFTRTGATWTQQQKLLASDGAAGDWLGFSVSLSGDTALIGAWRNDGNGSWWSGSAYVFMRTGSTWTQQQKLFASDGAAGDHFGHSVSIVRDTALIGAPGDSDNGSNSGSAYVFTRTGATWTQKQKLLASDGAAEDIFGVSVSLSGDTALIGAPGDGDNGNFSGSAYVFTRTGATWTQKQKLLASDGAPTDYFGYSVSLSGDTALIGAAYDDDYMGSAYVFINEKPPDPPTITGPASGKAGQPHNYTFNATDPNGDDVYYLIEWGDNLTSGWIGPYSSGHEMTQSHTWSKGTYTIKAKAKDIYSYESDWATLSVTMPYSYNIPFLPFLERLFERFPNAFPILRHFFGQ
jgi:hypothetical protein